MNTQQTKQTDYKKLVAKAAQKINEGNIGSAVKYAGSAFNQNANSPQAAGEYLFCLNELGRFDETLAAAKRITKKETLQNETVLANILCAALAVENEKIPEAMNLLSKLGLNTAQGRRKAFANFNYNPAQTSLIFNTAMVMHKAGKQADAEGLLQDTIEHIIFFIDNDENIDGALSREQAEVIREFMLLISESEQFASLENGEAWQELAALTAVGSHQTKKKKNQNKTNGGEKK